MFVIDNSMQFGSESRILYYLIYVIIHITHIRLNISYYFLVYSNLRVSSMDDGNDCI